MHSAPAVSYPVGRSRFQGWLVSMAGLAGMVAGLLWREQADLADLADWRQWLFAVILLGACLVAAQAWRRTPKGSLRWDGQAWSWTSVAVSACGVVTVHLDLQFCLLLSLRTDTGVRLWLWPERRAEVTRWNALRRAVFSRRGAAQSPAVDAGADLVQVKS